MSPLNRHDDDGSDNGGNEGVSGALGETEDTELTDDIPGLTSPHIGSHWGE